MLNRLAGFCFALLLAAASIYVAVRLIESVAQGLIVIGAVIGGIIIVGTIVRLVWQQRMNRW